MVVAGSKTLPDGTEIRWRAGSPTNFPLISGQSVDDNVVSRASEINDRVRPFTNYQFTVTTDPPSTRDYQLRVWDDDVIRIFVDGEKKRGRSSPVAVFRAPVYANYYGYRFRMGYQWFRVESAHDDPTLHNGYWARMDFRDFPRGHPFIGLIARGPNGLSISVGQACATDLLAALNRPYYRNQWVGSYRFAAGGPCMGGDRNNEYVGLAQALLEAENVVTAEDSTAALRETMWGGSRGHNRRVILRPLRDTQLAMGYRLQVHNRQLTRIWEDTVPAGTSGQRFVADTINYRGSGLIPCNYRVRARRFDEVPFDLWVGTHIRIDSYRPAIC